MRQSTVFFLALFAFLSLPVNIHAALGLEQTLLSQSRLAQDVAILSKINKNSSIIFVVGNYRSGKTTLRNYLNGTALKAVISNDNSTLIIIHAENSSVEICEARSKAYAPILIKDQRGNIFVDASQIRSSVNATVRLLNKLILSAIVGKVSNIKVILVIDALNLKEENQNYIKKELLETKNMFGQINGNMVIVVSKSSCIIADYSATISNILNKDDSFSFNEDRSYYQKVIKNAKIQQFCEASRQDYEDSIVNGSINVSQKKDRKKILEALNYTKSFKTSMFTVMFNEDEVQQIKKLIKEIKKFNINKLNEFGYEFFSLASKLHLNSLREVSSCLISKNNQNSENLQKIILCFESQVDSRINQDFVGQYQAKLFILRDLSRKIQLFCSLLEYTYDSSGNQHSPMIRLYDNEDIIDYSATLRIKMEKLLQAKINLQALAKEEGQNEILEKQLQSLKYKIKQIQDNITIIERRFNQQKNKLEQKLMKYLNIFETKTANLLERKKIYQQKKQKLQNQIHQIVKYNQIKFQTEQEVVNKSNKFDLAVEWRGFAVGLTIGLIIGCILMFILSGKKKYESVIKDKLQ